MKFLKAEQRREKRRATEVARLEKSRVNVGAFDFFSFFSFCVVLLRQKF